MAFCSGGLNRERGCCGQCHSGESRRSSGGGGGGCWLIPTHCHKTLPAAVLMHMEKHVHVTHFAKILGTLHNGLETCPTLSGIYKSGS